MVKETIIEVIITINTFIKVKSYFNHSFFLMVIKAIASNIVIIDIIIIIIAIIVIIVLVNYYC